MLPEILEQIKETGVETHYDEDVLVIAGTVKAVHAADWVMDKLIPTIYGRSLFCVNYEEDRATRLYRRVN